MPQQQQQPPPYGFQQTFPGMPPYGFPPPSYYAPPPPQPVQHQDSSSLLQFQMMQLQQQQQQQRFDDQLRRFKEETARQSREAVETLRRRTPSCSRRCSGSGRHVTPKCRGGRRRRSATGAENDLERDAVAAMAMPRRLDAIVVITRKSTCHAGRATPARQPRRPPRRAKEGTSGVRLRAREVPATRTITRIERSVGSRIPARQRKAPLARGSVGEFKL